MKKILSLLSMLMITVTAFATSYADKLTYKLTVFTALTKDLPAGELTIEPYGTSNYTVTAKGCDLSDFDAGNWDEIVCEDVAGTKDANGVTTITLDNPYAYRTSDNTSFSNTKLVVKFNGTKAYAHFEGKIKIGLALRAFEYTFGVDEGFDGGSTGGGETGGEVAAAFEKVNFVGDGTNFDWKIPVNWDTQKIVMSIDPSTCTGNCEDIIGLGEVATAWNNTLHLYRKTDKTLQGYFQIPGGSNNNTNPFDETNPIKVEVSKAKGFVVNDVVKIPASEMSALFALSTVNMGTGEGANDKSRATYNYVKVVDKDWTEVPPVTVVDTKEFKNVAYTTSMGGNGTATVTFTEMSDGTCPMTFNGAGYGISATNLTKGTDAKGRTTYTGQAVNDAASTVTYTVNAVVYTEGAEKKLYMTMVSVDGTTFTVGEDPDHVAPEPEIEGTVVEGSKNYAANGSKFEWSNIAINWNKQKLVAVIDLSSCTGTSENILSVGQNIGSWSIGGWHFYYTVASKKMKSDYLATDGAHPVSDPKTGVEPGTVRIELSKAEGCTIDGVSYNALYDSSVTGTWQSNTEDFWNLTSVNIGSKEGANRSNAVIKYVTVVDLPVTVKDEKTFNEALYMVQGTTSTKVADAKVVVKEMSDNTINMSLQFNGNEYTSTELTKGKDEKNRTTYTGKVSKDTQTFDVAGVVYEKETADRLYMTMTAAGVTFVVGENPDAVTPEVTEVSNKTYTSNLRIFDGEEPVVENAEAQVNIIKYSDESYKVTLKDVEILKKTQDLVFVGTGLVEEGQPLTIMAKSDEATTNVFGEQVSGTFEITEVSADEIKMGFSMESQNFSYQGEFNYTEEETPEVYTNNLHIYDAAAPETDLFQADQAKVEFLATATGEFKLTLKDVTLNEKTQDLVFTGTLPTTEPGGQEPLAEEGEVTPDEPAMVLNAIADEATTNFFGGGATYATAVFNVSYDKNDNFMMTFTIAAAKNYAGEFNYEVKTPAAEPFCKENYVADGNGFEWEIPVDWDTQKIVMSIDPSTCTGSCEHVIGLGAVPTAWNNTLNLYRTSADQMLQGYFQTSATNNNTGKFAETAPFLVEVSKAQGFVVNNEVKIASSAMSDLFTLSTVKMGTGEGANDKSRATYNYVKVVDKDWTAPKDPDTGINATTVAEGEVEFFTVNGVKLNKLQKGLNIVRTADGKVKKVLVK